VHTPVLIWEGGEPVVVGQQAMEGFVNVVAETAPHITQTMVTNLVSVPQWLLDLGHTHFNGRFETTFALANKMTWGQSETDYQKLFRANLRKVQHAGIKCTVNLELNKESIDLGVDALMDFIRETDCKSLEFDYSIASDVFWAAPRFGRGNYPLLRGTANHAEISTYYLNLFRAHGQELSDRGVHVGPIDFIRMGDISRSFNVLQESNFLTLNPDGTVTTNPLFSDFEPTFLGRLPAQSMDEIIAHPNRHRRIAYERKRTSPCASCRHLERCNGGPSHVQLHDESNECAGNKALWDYFAAEPVLAPILT
jgi:radical SAM protein with 4Fe4S-binding SPASM domain